MTDKEKIKDWAEKKLSEVESSIAKMAGISERLYPELVARRVVLKDLLFLIRSMQDEHKLKPKFQKGNKIVYVGERKEPDTEVHTILYVYDDMYATTWGKMIPFKFQDDYQLVEDPVSEELSTAAVEYERRINWNSFYCGLSIIDAFKAGAQWQKQQIQTDNVVLSPVEYQETIERYFKDGMKEQREQIMKDAQDYDVMLDNRGFDCIYPNGVRYGDKVKLIIINED